MKTFKRVNVELDPETVAVLQQAASAVDAEIAANDDPLEKQVISSLMPYPNALLHISAILRKIVGNQEGPNSWYPPRGFTNRGELVRDINFLLGDEKIDDNYNVIGTPRDLLVGLRDQEDRAYDIENALEKLSEAKAPIEKKLEQERRWKRK